MMDDLQFKPGLRYRYCGHCGHESWGSGDTLPEPCPCPPKGGPRQVVTAVDSRTGTITIESLSLNEED